MPLWPFGRKKRRTSTSSGASALDPDPFNEKRRALETDPRRDMPAPTQTSTRTPTMQNTRESQRKRKTTSNTLGAHAIPAVHEKSADHPLRNTSVQDITALPGVPPFESSPHLRPVKPHKPVIPYNLDRDSTARMAVSGPTLEHSTSSPAGRQRLTKRRDQDAREEHIRAMTTPLQIPKRPAGAHNDLLRRDSKKARRTFSSKQRSDDQRASTVSLPQSIPSSMSATSEQRGWEVGGIDILSPRPTVRLSVPGYYPQSGSAVGLSRKGSQKGKLPAIKQETSKKDRRRIADLADDLDSSDLRTVLERDARRKQQKTIEQQERLERKLRKRAEKQRAEEDVEEEREREREREQRALERTPPTAVHPAFRNQDVAEDVAIGLATPAPTQQDVAEQHKATEDSPSRGGTYLNYPARQHIPQNPFEDPVLESSPFADPQPEPSSATAEQWSPVQTPMEEPVLETARAVRLSLGHISPPASPTAIPEASESISELSERSPSVPRPFAQDQRRTSESSSRRAGTWASIFRRGPSISRTSVDHVPKSTPSESSFANLSRESMSRQAIPAHLIQQSARRAGTPVRTQSRFREDLPDAPMSPPDSRVQSPELTITAANAAVTRRTKRPNFRSSSGSATHESPDFANLGRTDSPVVSDDRDLDLPLSQSLASIDSEGSWMSGRLGHRRSTRRRHRDSVGSAGSVKKQRDDFAGSYEKLPVPDHEYFSSLTPDAGSRRTSAQVTPQSVQESPPPREEIQSTTEPTDKDNTPLRQNTAHRRPTVIHNEPRVKSREGLVAEYIASSAVVTPSRRSSVSGQESAENSPIEQSTVQNARSGYGMGHAKSLSAGSAKLLNIQPSRRGSRRASPASGSPGLPQSEFEKA